MAERMAQDELLRALEFDKVRQLLAGMTVTEPGRAALLALTPLAQRDEVALRLAETMELVAYMASASLPLAGSAELRPLLRELKVEGSWLSPEALLSVADSAAAAAACRKALGENDETPKLKSRVEGLAPLPALLKAIRRSIGARGEILDQASATLSELRRASVQLRGRIRQSLEGLLHNEQLSGVFQDRLVTERGGRYVLPVRSDHRGRVKGFIHDESASGQTLYVEPASVLERNNELISLLRETQREEERILRHLSAMVRGEVTVLLQNQQVLAHLDLLGAASRFARACDATAPHLAAVPCVALYGARHPLLLFQADGRRSDKEVVSIDLCLDEEELALVVSGPNTGGKTVALKTLGLLVLMVKAGLPIPCQPESRLYLFGQLYADIGDDQSIEESLSTFSGHLLHVRKILERADCESLVLLDEVGTGTDPAEGGALALALFDTLATRGARVMATTHLNMVKGYTHLQKKMRNAAVEFDAETLAPTYRLHYGIPGASNAFAIARRLGIPDDVLDLAESYLDPEERQGLSVLEELNRLQAELVHQRRETDELRRAAARDRDKRRRLLAELEEGKKELLDKAAKRGEALVRKTEARLNEVLQQTSQPETTLPEQARLRGEVRELRSEVGQWRQEPPRPAATVYEVAAGEIVRIPALNVEAEVVTTRGKMVELLVRGKKLRQPLRALETYSPRRFARRGKVNAVSKSTLAERELQSRLLLVGKRVDEALPLLARFLDDALLQSQREVEIVHGSGEGILRKVVREELARHRAVAAFSAADIAHGGENVTVVTLKEA